MFSLEYDVPAAAEGLSDERQIRSVCVALWRGGRVQLLLDYVNAGRAMSCHSEARFPMSKTSGRPNGLSLRRP